MRFLFMGILESESVSKKARKCSAVQGPHCEGVPTNVMVHLQEVARPNGGHIKHVLH